MSKSEENQEKELEETQKNQKKIGAAESNPKTTGPAEKLRENAAESLPINRILLLDESKL
jgi:hypothetical protein